jgi:hypothetical protein
VAHTLWIGHTHLMDKWESTPRLAAISPEPGSGKTRVLEVTETLVPRPLQSINNTVAALFRNISDPDGSCTCALWDAVLPLSLPEPTDPPITVTWRALVKMSEEYARLADGNPVPRPTTIRDEEVAQASGLRGTA